MDVRGIVSELYALRAGLSLISQEKDKFDAEIKVANERKSTAVAQAKSAADSAMQEMIRIDNMLAKAKSDLDARQKQYEENNEILKDTCNVKEFMDEHKHHISQKRAMGTLFTLLYIASAIIVPIILFATNLSFTRFLFIPILVTNLIIGIIEICIAVNDVYFNEIGYGIPYILNVSLIGAFMIMVFCGVDGGFFYWAVFVLSMIFYVICTVVTVKETYEYIDMDAGMVNFYKEKLSKRELATIELSALVPLKQHAQEEYIDIKHAYENIRDIHLAAEEKYKMTCLEEERVYLAAYAVSAETHGKICSVIYDSLVRTYGELLDVRDWGILDLVIWQLETGRAETLKEALQLADRETQTDRIVQTMQSASAAISQKIEHGFGSLQAQLSNSFYTLATGLASAASSISNQISRSSDMLAGKISENNEVTVAFHESQMDNMITTNRNLEQLFSQASLQTALLEKSHSSSKELINAVNKLRNAQNA